MVFEREETFLWRLNAEEDATVIEALNFYLQAAPAAGQVLAHGLLAQRGTSVPPRISLSDALKDLSPVPMSALISGEQLAAAKAETEKFNQLWGTVKPAGHEGADK